jgi:hypothetical protein
VPGPPVTLAEAIPGHYRVPVVKRRIRRAAATVGLPAVGIYLRKEVDPLELSEWAHLTLYAPHS